MTLQRIESRFAATKASGRRAVLPYFTAGYPDASTVAALIRRADEVGATVVELGIPFSDSIADGQTIQRSFHQALKRGLTVDDTLPALALDQGRYYVTAVTHQGQRRYGRKSGGGILTGRDPALLPGCGE